MKIKIHGAIVDAETKRWETIWCDGESDLVTFKDLDEALANKPKDDKIIELDINCPGGNVIEGLAIYDKLRSMEGCTIISNAIGECSSMATVIFLAASQRISQPNTRFCVHKPRYTNVYYSQITEDEAKRIYEDLHAETERFVKIYNDRINLTPEEIEALMGEDKYISADEALSIGLVTEIAVPMTARKKNDNPKYSRNMKLNALKNFLKTIGLADEPAPVAMTLNTEDGTSIEIEREDGEPAVGDVVLSDTPDGEYKMSDGTTIVIADGIITEIRPKEAEEEEATTEQVEEALAKAGDKIESLTEENESLKSQVEDLKTQLSASKANEKSAQDIEALDFIANAGGIVTLKSLVGGKKPQAREVKSEAGELSDNAKQIIEKYNNQNK